MTLLQGTADFLLVFLRDLVVAVNGRVIFLISLAGLFFDGSVEIGDKLGGDATPWITRQYNRALPQPP